MASALSLPPRIEPMASFCFSISPPMRMISLANCWRPMTENVFCMVIPSCWNWLCIEKVCDSMSFSAFLCDITAPVAPFIEKPTLSHSLAFTATVEPVLMIPLIRDRALLTLPESPDAMMFFNTTRSLSYCAMTLSVFLVSNPSLFNISFCLRIVER